MPSARELRWFGLLFLLFFALIAAIAFFRFDALRVAAGLVGGAALVTGAYYALPSLRIPLFRAWMTIFSPVGWVVSHALLAIVYYGILTPIGLLLRLFRDPMLRRFDPDAASYWVERESDDDLSRYFRQS